MYKPKVSILIPCYNAIEFIEETINSVIKQDYPNVEVIIRDDRSTDGTWELLLNLSDTLPIKIFRNEINLGMCGNWNILFKEANGDLILKLDADDVLLSDFINKAINVFNEDNKVDAVTFAYDILENNRRSSLQVHQSIKSGLQDNLFSTIFFKNPFHLCFTVFKKQSIKPLGNGNYFLKTEIGDLDFLLRFAKGDANLYFIEETGGAYRYHPSNSSKSPLRQAKSWINDIFPAHRNFLKDNFYKDTKKVLLNRVINYLKSCIYYRQKIDFDYLKVSLLTYLKF